MMGENRFASLTRTFPERAEILFAEAEDFTRRRYARYKHLAGQDIEESVHEKIIE